MKKYRSIALEIVHRTASNHHRDGLLDETKMQEFDATCLFVPEEFSPRDLEALRKREGVSHTIFAGYLNVPESFVRDWERGTRKPAGPAVRLLSLIKAKGLNAIL
jgi:putative transcriptional regulator